MPKPILNQRPSEQERRALILGISGQDGALLARFLLSRGYKVFGGSRDAEIQSFRNLERLGIKERVELVSLSLMDFRSVLKTISSTCPDEIYNLAGQSSVGLSFEIPVETFDSISVATVNLLEAIRFHDSEIRFYNACSSECFGDTQEPASEDTAMRPRSPYAVAKAAAYWQVANYREGYGVFAASGILFNHESPLRPTRFVVQKIVSAAKRIAAGSDEKLRLGDLGIVRDWGWAQDYVIGMWQILQTPSPRDYVLATGRSSSLEELVAESFSQLALNWREHVVQDTSLIRPTDLSHSLADPRRAGKELGWQSSCSLSELVSGMIAEKLD